VSFDEIAGIVGRTPTAARQLASRGRRRVQGASEDGRAAEVARHRDIVVAFFRASRAGDLRGLLAVLDPEVALKPDAEALRMGQRTGWLPSALQGAEAVASRFSGQAEAAQPALIDGAPGGVWYAGGRPVVAFGFTIRDGKVAEIELIADAERLSGLQIEILR
jgi:RNA polymerase sigma-70 factor (ECF subfamily)